MGRKSEESVLDVRMSMGKDSKLKFRLFFLGKKWICSDTERNTLQSVGHHRGRVQHRLFFLKKDFI